MTALSIRLSPMTALFRLRVPVHACTRAVCVCRVCQCCKWGVWVRLILSCISTEAGLGHINILINMRESITEEARA